MVNSRFLLNNLYAEGFCNFKVDVLQLVRNIASQHFTAI
ncbi:hypothetical protein HKBW3S43_02001, partial [Candidatus Hakubella thermalkaliphila]